jgi:hypothetical protein
MAARGRKIALPGSSGPVFCPNHHVLHSRYNEQEHSAMQAALAGIPGGLRRFLALHPARLDVGYVGEHGLRATGC